MSAVVLVVATLAATAPLALRSMTTSEVEYQLEGKPLVRRDLIGRMGAAPDLAPGAAPFSAFSDTLAGLRKSAEHPLQEAMGTPEFLVTSERHTASRLGGVWNDPISELTVNATPDLADLVTMTAGSPPARFSAGEAIEIILSTETAERSEWKVGETRILDGVAGGIPVLLAGTFAPLDESAHFWALAPTAVIPAISHTSFSGTNTLIVGGTAFIDPDSWPVLLDEAPELAESTTTVGIPLSTSGLTVDEDERLLPQLRHFMDTSYTLGKPRPGSEPLTITFSSEAPDFLTTALTRAATATVVFAMVASGPIGVAIAALWLLSRLIVLRRKDSLALSSARGASGVQLRAMQALECLLLSAPAAAIGGIVAFVLFPAAWSPASVWFAAVAAIVPPLLLALAASPRSLRGIRGDLDPRARGRYRWVLEVIVLALTGLSVYLLLQRGLTSSATTVGVDPLLAATPLLLSLAAGLVVLRLYPLPLVGFARSVRRRRGIVAFLGASRSIRDPAAGLAPVLAMVVGLAVAVFSGVLLGTVAGGLETAAQSSVGADLRIDSAPLDDDQLARIAATEGVEDSVSLSQSNRLQNLSVEENLSAPTIVVDTAALARVQAGVPGTLRFTRDLATMVDGRLPVLLSPDLASHYSIGDDSSYGDADIVNGGDPGTSPSLSGVADWVLIDRANADKLGIYTFQPRITLVRLAPDADASTVAAALAAIAGADATVTSPADAASELRASPVSGGLQLALLALIGIVALLCAAAVVLALMISGPARERLLALLRTLGLTPRQARGITSWEIGPTAGVAIVAGLVLGAVLPLIVVSGVDLRPFTGGVLQPRIVLDPALLGIVVGGFALLVVLATIIAMVAARRVSLARTLRTAEDG
jgi:putative ABC transport system permease protein